ncbi:MAG: non-canonical purine NTP diphosphatase [Bacteroidales bacterium]|nr:non-canonical purine NTP diphosphatase [Bacteroidales bacterium]
MTHELIFATNNLHKLAEIQSIVGKNFTIKSLHEIGCTEDIAETAPTLQGNALLKAQYIYDRFGKNCFADDTGLEVEALDGRPGVFSARYATDGHDFEANIDKVLGELMYVENRKARFRTVIALILGGSVQYFEGIVNGEIIAERKGVKGFGYDPVFLPDGYKLTFAEMPLDEKNKISHRARAVSKLVEFLNLEI